MSDTHTSNRDLVPRVNPEVLIAQAIEKGLPVETMERLLAMRAQLQAEAARGEFFGALSAMQSRLPRVQKGKTVMSTDGRTVRYRYANLDDIVAGIQPLLLEHGFSFTVKTRQDPTQVTAICEIHHRGGHTEATEFTIPIDPKAYMNAAQKVASALTYAKRYAFCNGFGVLTGDEDDDGIHTEDAEEKKEETPAPKATGTKLQRTPEQQAIIDDIVAVVKPLGLPEDVRSQLRERIQHTAETAGLQKILDEVKTGAKLWATMGAEPAVQAPPFDPPPPPAPAKSPKERDLEKLEQIRKDAADAAAAESAQPGPVAAQLD